LITKCCELCYVTYGSAFIKTQ